MGKAWLVPQYAFVFLISLYQYCISPVLGPKCRFYPTCSSYMSVAVLRFGLCKGAWLGLCRLCKCHPWQTGGIDPVPENKR